MVRMEIPSYTWQESMPHPAAIPPPNSTHAALIYSPGDPTGRARKPLSHLPFSQCFYREHLQALPFVQHILKEKEGEKKEKKKKSAKVQYVFLLLSSLTNSSHLSLPHFMRLCSCTGPFLVCPDLNGTNLPDSLVNHVSGAIPDRPQPEPRGDCQSPKDGSSYFASSLAGFVSL